MSENNSGKPYGVVNADCLDAMKRMSDNSIDAIVTDPPYGLDFMGKNWDHGVPGIEFWKGALRVAKPGAHLLAFGGTRTYHRLACAIEDAGWEVRDCLGWIYSSGMPKSMDISKAIDKKLGAQRAVREAVGDKGGIIGFGVKNRCPKCGKPFFSANPCTCPRDDLVPITDEAKKWSGWGTCLKPAFEPIVLARKPVEGTVVENVMKNCVGGLNIDECRVPYEEGGTAATNPLIRELRGCKNNHGADKGASWRITGEEGKVGHANLKGRFPANIIHDGSDEVLEVFPNDSARFFYCPKASKKEKGKDNVHPTVKPIELMKYLVKLVTPKGALVLDPFMGSGTTGVAAIEIGRRFLGIEKESEYFKIAENRLEQAKLESPEVV